MTKTGIDNEHIEVIFDFSATSKVTIAELRSVTAEDQASCFAVLSGDFATTIEGNTNEAESIWTKMEDLDFVLHFAAHRNGCTTNMGISIDWAERIAVVFSRKEALLRSDDFILLFCGIAVRVAIALGGTRIVIDTETFVPTRESFIRIAREGGKGNAAIVCEEKCLPAVFKEVKSLLFAV
ncbi:MAG: hypothetical protein ABL904_00135 [Hyphomicrobiaceae bacterium]